MRLIWILLLISQVVLSQTCENGEFQYFGACVKSSCTSGYLPRMQTVVGNDGINRIPIVFAGEVSLESDNSIKVAIRFSDKEQDGLTKRDNDWSCIDAVLNRYGNNYVNEQTDPSQITSSYDKVSQLRIWTFTVSSADFTTKLVKNASVDGMITYNGYYSYKFMVGTYVQMAYYFTFQIILNTDLQSTIKTDFGGLIQREKIICVSSNNCISNATSSLQFCLDSACSEPTNTLNIHLNQKFYIIQKITNPGFEHFGLADPIVFYIGSGLLKKVTPISINNTSLGYQILELQADFVYGAVAITVRATLQTPTTRLLLENNLNLQESGTSVNAHAFAESDTIDCIRESETSSLCPSKADMCRINGYSNDGDCNITCSSNWLTLIPVLLTLLSL